MTASISPLRADIDLDAPGRHVGHVRLPHSTHESAYGWIPVPIASIKGGEGPSVLLTAGNHGDEYEGQIALLKLIRELDPAALHGRVIVMPRLNLPAAAAGRRTSPIDDGNLIDVARRCYERHYFVTFALLSPQRGKAQVARLLGVGHCGSRLNLRVL